MKCRQCGKKDIEPGIQVGLSNFCTKAHAIEYIASNRDKDSTKRMIKSHENKKVKEQKKKDKARLKELTPRTTWFAKWLQPLVNQYVRDVLEADKLCYTCGNTNNDTKMNAGHFIPVGAGGGDRRRFMHENIKRQCEFCNTHKGGDPKGYRLKLVDEFGIEWVEWLECESNHPTLKEQFPTWQDIENEIKRYRKLIREAGLTPCK